MPTARHGLMAVGVGNNIYVIGGGPTPDISFANVKQADDSKISPYVLWEY
jgi:hypothetical protein